MALELSRLSRELARCCDGKTRMVLWPSDGACQRRIEAVVDLVRSAPLSTLLDHGAALIIRDGIKAARQLYASASQRDQTMAATRFMDFQQKE